MRFGIARSMNSNEAGQGSSPFIHGSADCEHPMRQGLWGSFEVFVDTLLVCSITALAVLSTGVWTTGTPGVTLTMMAYYSGFGVFGKYFIGFLAFLFGVTTTTGWFTYYCSCGPRPSSRQAPRGRLPSAERKCRDNHPENSAVSEAAIVLRCWNMLLW